MESDPEKKLAQQGKEGGEKAAEKEALEDAGIIDLTKDDESGASVDDIVSVVETAAESGGLEGITSDSLETFIEVVEVAAESVAEQGTAVIQTYLKAWVRILRKLWWKSRKSPGIARLETD